MFTHAVVDAAPTAARASCQGSPAEAAVYRASQAAACQPAGGGAFDLFGDAAALWGVSTLPRFRRRGVQLALLIERMRLARAEGAQLATIASVPWVATERNAARAGFQVAYTKVVLHRPGAGLAPAP